MANPIRLDIEVLAGQASISGVEQLASRIASDVNQSVDRVIQSAVSQTDRVVAKINEIGNSITKISNAATIGFREAFAAPTQQLTQMLSLLERIEQVTSRVRSVGSGGSSAGGGGSAGTVNNLRAELARLEAAGFDFSGRSTKVYTPTSTTTATELLNEQGRRLTATYNTQGNLSRLSLGLQPKPEPTQAEVYAKQMADQQVINTRLTAFDTAKRLADDQKAKEAAAESAAQETRITESVNRGREFFAANGYNQVGQRVVGTANGEQTTLIMRNQEGAIGRLELATGRYTANLETAKSRWSGITSAIGESWGTTTKIAAATAAWYYSISNISSTIKAITFDPLVAGIRKVADATEDSRRFEYAISGSVGGLSNARQINRALVNGSQDSPLSVGQYREATQTLALNPVLASRLSLGKPEDSVAQAGQFAGLVGRLGQIEPEQGVQGATIAIRESLQGNFQSLQRRLGITPETLSSLAGVKRDELVNHPDKILKGIGSFADIFLPQSEFERSKSLISVRVQHLQDALEAALAKVGNSGIFDSASKRIGNLSKQLFSYFDGKDFDTQAKRISDSFDKILGNLSDTIKSVVSTLTGKPEDVSTVGGVVTTIADVLSRVADLSDNLPKAISGIIPAITTFVSTIGNFVDAVTSLAQVINNPQAGAQGFIDRNRARYASATDDATGVTFNDKLLKIFKANGIDTEKIGTSDYDAKTSADDVYKEIRSQNPGGLIGNPANFLHAAGAMYLSDFKEGYGASVSTQQQLDYRRLSSAQQRQAAEIERSVRSGVPIPTKNPSITDVYGANTELLPPRGDENPSASYLRAYYKSEIPLPNFGTLTKLAGFGNEKLTALAERAKSPIDRLSEASSGLFADVSISDAEKRTTNYTQSQFRDYLKKQYDESMQGLQYRMDQQTNLGQKGDFNAGRSTEFIRSQMDDLTKSYNATITQITAEKLEGVRQFSEALGNSLKDFPPEAQLAIQRSIYNGTTSLANQYAKSFGEPEGGRMRAFGFDSLTTTQQLQSVRNFQRSGLATADEGLKNGQFTPRQAVQGRIDFLSGNEFQSMQTRVLANATTAAANNPNSEIAAANLSSAQNQIATTQNEMKVLRHSIDDGAQAWEEFGARGREALESNLGSAIANLIKGTGSLKDALLGFVNDITQAFSQMAAKQVITSLIGQAGVPGQGTNGQPGAIGGILGNATGWLGGLFKAGGGAGAGAGAAAAIPGPTPIWAAATAATGGIFPGSFIPMRAFSGGGIATRPTFGLIAEAGMNEAMVPLPNGTHIPVEWKNGGAQRQGDTYIVNSVDEAVNRGFVRHRDTMINTVTNEVMRGGTRTNRAVRRA